MAEVQYKTLREKIREMLITYFPILIGLGAIVFMFWSIQNSAAVPSYFVESTDNLGVYQAKFCASVSRDHSGPLSLDLTINNGYANNVIFDLEERQRLCAVLDLYPPGDNEQALLRLLDHSNSGIKQMFLIHYDPGTSVLMEKRLCKDEYGTYSIIVQSVPKNVVPIGHGKHSPL